MQTGHKRWTAFASATAAVVAIGCGDLTTDTAPGGASDPSVETKASAVETKPSAVATPSGALEPRTRFFIPPPNPGAVQQIVDLAKERKLIDAARITAMEATPHAVWFTDGSPSEVRAAVRKTVKAAALLRTVPVLVAYNIPFRDCAQYSAGGALDTAAYRPGSTASPPGSATRRPWSSSSPTAWASSRTTATSGARRSGDQPDRPARRDPANALRADELRRRQNLREERANAPVYLDGTHSAWLGVGDVASRLASAGVARARGVLPEQRRITSSRRTSCSTAPGSRQLPRVRHLGRARRLRGVPEPVLERRPAAVQDRQINGEWNGTALDAGGQWSDASDDRRAQYVGNQPALRQHAGRDPGRRALRHRHEPQRPGSARRHAVRRRALQPAGGGARGAPGGNWCNPPGAGLGLRPTANTGVGARSMPTSGSRCRASRTARATSPAGRGRGTSPPTTRGASPLPPRTTSTRCGA